MKHSKLFLIFFVLVPLWTVMAQQKYALVIGNGAYQNIAKLNNPVNDANDMADTLTGMGFTVDKVINGSLGDMEDAVIKLKSRLQYSPSSYGFFFYAGHGVQSQGENYLIPVDADIKSESFLRQRAMQIQSVLDELNQAGNTLNVIVLDACRDNPFSWSRSGTRGLQTVSTQPADSIIVYATSGGSVAADGTGRNGLFTEQLLKNMKTTGLEVSELFRRTGSDVKEVSGGKQIPAIYNQFFGTAYLGAQAVATVQSAAPPQTQAAATPAPAATPAAQTAPAATAPKQSAGKYKVGDTGPGGGIIFYDKGDDKDGWRYLEAAPAATEKIVQSFKSDKRFGGISERAFGAGLKNTQQYLEVLKQTYQTWTTPPSYCDTLTYKNVSDWYLPSLDELLEMYKVLHTNGTANFSPSKYFTSTCRTDGSSYVVDFATGQAVYSFNNGTGPVRACRRF